MPRLQRNERMFVELVALARRLSAAPSDRVAAASLQAPAAHGYGLSVHEFEHVLDDVSASRPSGPRAALQVFVDRL